MRPRAIAASHVCLHQPDHRLLISGDHLLGRIVLWFDRGDTPDPVADYLRSLDVIAGAAGAPGAIGARAKPFLDVPGHIKGSREAVHEQLALALRALADGPRSAIEVAEQIDDEHVAGARGTGSAGVAAAAHAVACSTTCAARG